MRVHTVKMVHLSDLMDALHFNGAIRDRLLEHLSYRFTWGTANFALVPNWAIEDAMSNFLSWWVEEVDVLEIVFDEDKFRQQFNTLVADDVYIDLEN